MTRSNLKKLVPLLAFLATELTLGILLQVASGRAVALYSYTSVCLACLFCLSFAQKSLPYALTQLALLCTVAADYFLVLCEPRQQLPAMLFFSVTQLAYATRILYRDTAPRRRRVHLIIRASLCAVALLVTRLVLKDSTDALALVSIFYYANLILNVVFAFCLGDRQPLLALGLLLFLMCDTVIGLDLLNTYLPIPSDSLLYAVIRPGFNLAWVFYLPSQVLLALSLLPDRKSGTEG